MRPLSHREIGWESPKDNVPDRPGFCGYKFSAIFLYLPIIGKLPGLPITPTGQSMKILL